ncbi:protein arginine N-methyltransferase [Xylaria nigripes]|nr:protein arginine N-methyltransferase [Xylaria nigripes]
MSYENTTHGSVGPDEIRPTFHIGRHESTEIDTLTDLQYGQILNSGFKYVTTPITNTHFHDRVVKLVGETLSQINGQQGAGSIVDPIVASLTPDDTTLYPEAYTSGFVAYVSPWIDLCSPNHVIASISRQVLNLEVGYANFCGVRSIILPGPKHDTTQVASAQGIAQYARAIQEALVIGARVNLIIHLPMYREPGLEKKVTLLSISSEVQDESQVPEEIDVFSTWDSWHVIRTACDYDARLFVALRLPWKLPTMELQTRWFSEPVQYLTFSPATFQTNKAGHPSLSRYHQEMIKTYMRLKHAPYFLLCDTGSAFQEDLATEQAIDTSLASEFPTLAEAAATQSGKSDRGLSGHNPYLEYLHYLEKQQDPYTELELSTLTNFQDWLQSPLQPLSDNLESVTYEVFEGDPIKYNQYESAIEEALSEWSILGKPTSSPDGVVIAVVGSGRGPLVTRALWASETTGVPIKVWAIEKNPNAYVYLLRQNRSVWGGRVTVVKTDMRAWKGPIISAPDSPGEPVYGKVDILVSELLGSFGDNELSPECLDGIQHVLAPNHGISIPSSYTAHISPISTPRLHADIKQRWDQASSFDSFNTPWVVRLFAIDFVANRVPGHERFQMAWEFQHPLPQSTMDAITARRSGGVVGGGGGSMAGGVGANDHNTRQCHLTFVCRTRGVIHGLAGYFESVLYKPQMEDDEGNPKPMVELSTLPTTIDQKSKNLISWFPIFFPLKQPLYFPPDSELEITMWRQTDDAKVWYEWMVEAFVWVSETQRVKVGGSDLCSSRNVACLM